MSHDNAIHRQATINGDFADEVLYDAANLTLSLLHFADDSHGARLDLAERGISFVVDTPIWLDVDAVVQASSPDEPTLASGYAMLERQEEAGHVGYRLTLQGGDVVSRLSVILLEAELSALHAAVEAGRERIETADELDNNVQQPENGAV